MALFYFEGQKSLKGKIITHKFFYKGDINEKDGYKRDGKKGETREVNLIDP